ncbi:MAG: hypothetical protein WCG31_01815 [Deltaproteobacteria bacterium]
MARKTKGITRRDFIKYTSATATILASGGLLASCGSSNGFWGSSPTAKEYEKRTYLFNLNHIDFSKHDLILVAGTREYPLAIVNQEVFSAAALSHPYLSAVGIRNVSHHAYEISMPKGRHQICYIRMRNKTTGQVTIPFTFWHFPRQRDLKRTLLGATSKPHMSVKWKRYGINSSLLTSSLFDDSFKDVTDHASQLVSSFPQISSLDPTSATSINNNIIGSQDSTYDLADSLSQQGANWAINRPLIDPTTGKQCVDDKGNPMFTLQWTPQTSKSAGKAIQDSNNSLQNDSDYGLNTTNSQSGDANLTGKIWDFYEGTTYRKPAGTGRSLKAANGLSYTTTATDMFRYHLEVVSVDASRNITFKIKNTGSRYLIGGVAYKDANGNLMTYSDIGYILDPTKFRLEDVKPDQTGFPLNQIVGPALKFLAIPLKGSDTEFTVPTPSDAETILLLGGGPGSTANLFPAVSSGGWCLTAMMCWAVPILCTALDGAEAYEGISEGFNKQPTFQTLIIDALADAAVAVTFRDTDALKDLGVQAAECLLTARFAIFMGWLGGQIGSASMFNAFPIVGQVAEAIGAAADAASIAESIYDTANAPMIYQTNLVVSHTINLTITHDPDDSSGFPATSAYYIATVHISNATPVYSDRVPVTNLHQPSISQIFNTIPVGGTVTIAVAFYGDDGCQVGQGAITADNSSANDLSLTIQLKELLHPLTPQTHYIHREKIILDAGGNHVWHTTSTPPTLSAADCTNGPGKVCQYGGMTVSNNYAGIGYVWRGYKTAQQWQFANMSVGDNGNPQSGYIVSPPSAAKIPMAYSLLGDGNMNFYVDANGYLRQVRLQLNGQSQFDSPTSNLSWGRLQFSSDDLLLHPEGKLISISTDYSKLEIVTLPSSPVADASALWSSAYGGQGQRPGLLDAPTLCALSPKGELLILEVGQNRVSSYDSNANPVPTFGAGIYSFKLASTGALYLDMAVEHAGYIYVLYNKSGVIFLDIYDPTGHFVSTTSGINAANICVTLWREVYTMNYEVQKLPNDTYPALSEPSISHWIPFGGCGQSSVTAASAGQQSCGSGSPTLRARLRDIVEAVAARLG